LLDNNPYEPIIQWRCKENTLQSPLLVARVWWVADANTGMVSPDGETMKGSYQSPIGPANGSWA